MRVAILGCGVMGSAFARQLAKNGHSLILNDRNHDRLTALAEELGADCASSVREAATAADCVLLAIKPKDLKGLARDIGDLDGQIILSIMTGAKTLDLKKLFKGCEVVRSMPNLALSVGESVIALVDDPELPLEVKGKIEHLLEKMGYVFWTQEDKIEAITALAGSGPAFVLAFIEALVESGILMGLRADMSQELAMQTILGAVGLLKAQKGHPGKIRWQISAPGGTTIAGMRALEAGAFRSVVMETILATYNKAKEMS